jgi:hypothetical protein
MYSYLILFKFVPTYLDNSLWCDTLTQHLPLFEISKRQQGDVEYDCTPSVADEFTQVTKCSNVLRTSTWCESTIFLER